jgi:hypothetical protein
MKSGSSRAFKPTTLNEMFSPRAEYAQAGTMRRLAATRVHQPRRVPPREFRNGQTALRHPAAHRNLPVTLVAAATRVIASRV